jgi:DNA processing protein
MSIHPEIIKYSAHPDITFWDLKSWDFDKYDIPASELKNIQSIFQEHNIGAFMMWQDDYHYKFHSIPSKPYIVHYIWDLSLLDKNILAIVGPRKPSVYSHKVLKKLFEYAENYDLVTISGMAGWVDQLAHALSIKHKIPTIAVLWWWLNHFLKWAERHIVQSIVDNRGLVLSEYKINFVPTKYSFPQRNRIIAGLSDMVFLPEAWESSWSLITADFANQSSRPVYVVPNDIFSPTSFGVHQLISQQKANILIDFKDFFDQNFKKFGVKHTVSTKILDLPAPQNDIIWLLSNNGEMSLWAIMQATGLDADTVMQHITLLEINNHIYQNSPWKYSLY